MDDSKKEIRIAACEGFSFFYKIAYFNYEKNQEKIEKNSEKIKKNNDDNDKFQSVLGSSVLEYVTKALKVHLDDEDGDIRVSKCVSSI